MVSAPVAVAVALALGAAFWSFPHPAATRTRVFLGAGTTVDDSGRAPDLIIGAGASFDVTAQDPISFTFRGDVSPWPGSDRAAWLVVPLGLKVQRTGGLVRPYLEGGAGFVVTGGKGCGEGGGFGMPFGGGIHVAPSRGPGYFVHLHYGHGVFLEGVEGTLVLVRLGVASR